MRPHFDAVLGNSLYGLDFNGINELWLLHTGDRHFGTEAQLLFLWRLDSLTPGPFFAIYQTSP